MNDAAVGQSGEGGGEPAHSAQRVVSGLPVDLRRGTSRGTASSSHTILIRELSPSLWSAVQGCAADLGQRPDTVVLALFAVLIARLSGNEQTAIDVARGSSWQNLDIGVNPAADLTGAIELLNQAQSDSAPESVPHAEVGFSTDKDADTDGFGVFVTLTVDSDVAILAVEFDADTWRPERGVSLLDQLVQLIANAIGRPHSAVFEHSLITDRARQQLPDASAPITVQRYAPVADTVKAIADYAGEAVAVRHRGRSWTYRQLMDAALQVGRSLVSAGCTRGDAVAVVGGNSFGLIATTLGVWLAGGVVVPIDPRSPRNRQLVMRETADVTLVADLISGGGGSLELREGETQLLVDPLTGAVYSDTAGLVGDRSVELPVVTDDDLAYIIFTSGSTGTPKGVLGYHGGLAHFLEWQRDRFNIGPGDRGAQLTAVGFDVVLRAFFLPLISRATVVLPEAEAVDAEAILPWMVDERITFTHLVPSIAAAWLADGHGQRVPSLRRVFFAGEPLSDGLIADWRREISNSAVIVNLYGPTETTLAKCFYVVGDELRPGTTLVGSAIPGAQVLVLNDDRACGVGEVGEIVLRTPYRSRGYLRDTGLDQSCFVTNPATRREDDRLYRTGDLGRFLPDGDLEILGRRDQQLKIHGVRVELGEIETVLRRQDSVTAAAVSVWADAGGEPTLVGYLVVADDFDLAALEAAIAADLPRAMRPSAFVLLNELPRTSSGKIDRKALPAPIPVDTGEFAAPTTPTEVAVHGFWCDVLDLSEVSIDADFFASGGHSIRAVRLASRINRAFGVQLSIADVFDRSTIREMAAFIDSVADDQRSAVVPVPEIVHVENRTQPLLSNAQRRMWLLHQVDTQSATYNVPRAFDITGDIDSQALAAAVTRLVTDHDALRTAIAVDANGSPIAVPLPPEPSDIMELADVSSGPDPLAERDRLTDEFVRRPFDLATEYPIRALLIRSDVSSARFVFVVHHVATDGWSSAQLIRELSENYDAIVAGTDPPLRSDITYADFAEWESAQDTAPTSDVEYWRQQLAGAARLELPFDHPRSGGSPSSRGATLNRILPPETDRLLRASTGEGFTPFGVTLCAFMLQLAQITRGNEVIVGTPSSGRSDPALDDTVGFFSNTLVLRHGEHEIASFADVVGRLRSVVADALSHEKLPFDRLVEILDPPREPGTNPFFDVMFICTEADPELVVSGAEVTPVHVDTGTAHFPLMLTVSIGASATHVSWEYDADLFDDQTIARFASHFEQILSAALADTSQDVIAVTAMRGELLDDVFGFVRGPRVDCPPESVPEQILARALADPDAPAVINSGRTLTYGELIDRARDVAGTLIAAGIERNEAVGVCSQRGASSVTCLLGIWFAGAVYTPINPAYPDTRIESIFDAAEPKIVLVDDAHSTRLDAFSVRTIRLADVPSNPEVELRMPAPDDSSYVVFTSGSTGKPKGVEQTHRTLMNLVAWQRNDLPLKSRQHVALFAAFGFDVSLQEMSYTLASGAELHVTPLEARSDAVAFWDFVEDHQIEIIFMPTAALDAVCDSAILADPKRGESLKAIVVAGEALKITQRIRRVFTMLGDCKLVNHYGPSETHVVTVHTLDGDPETWPYLPPIGHPVPNTDAYILGRGGNLLPIGSTGELYVGGDQVARGYLKRDDLTVERFGSVSVRSGDEEIDLGRLYRTGDLVRLNGDGDLEFRGRADTQVKVRGNRVELSEIEVRLSSRDDVEQAVVELRTEDNDQFLACYLVPAEGSTIDPAEVSATLHTELPDYMVPEAFVVVSQIPLNANGKVATNELPTPHRIRFDGGRSYAAPRSEMEKQLTALFADVLHVDRVGIDDDFFELGGHSLRAAALAARARTELGCEVTLRDLFASPTVRQLTVALEAARAEGDAVHQVVLTHDPSPSAPLSPPQMRVWLVQEFGVDPRSYVVPVAVKVDGEVDLHHLQEALDALVARQDVLRTRVVQDDDTPVQIGDSTTPGIECIDVSDAVDPRSVAKARILTTLGEPFDVEHGPLFRVLWIRLAPGEHVLAFSLHHLVADGASLSIIARDLSELYSAIRARRRPTLPALEYTYRDWSRLQRDLAGSSELVKQMDYWRGELAGIPAESTLPFDHPRPVAPTYRGGDVEFDLPPHITKGLREIAHDSRCSLFPVLIAAFGALISRCSGQDTAIVGIPVDDRGSEFKDLVGFFVRSVALKVDVVGDPSFRDLVARTWDHQRRALANQQVPFNDIVNELAPDRTANRNPIFQTMVVLEEASEDARLQLEELAVHQFPVRTDYSSFDLTWFVRNEGDRIRSTVKFSEDLFERETVQRFVNQLECLVESALADPDKPISVLEMVDAAQREEVLVTWNNTDRDYDNEGTLHGFFEAQAARTPEALAITQSGRGLTYSELDSCANALATQLVAAGVGPERLVAICLPRSIEALVCVFAVLKAGGAYVPLDPSHPRERSEHVMSDCGASILLTSAEYADEFDTAVPIVEVDDCATVGDSATSPEVDIDPSNAAYVIYTSGSTGKPKGVVIEHRSARNYINWCVDAYQADSGYGSPWLSSLSFDLTVTSLFPVLAVGGCVSVIEVGTELDAGALASVRDASLIKLTPAHLSIVADELTPEDASLWTHDAIIGGEALEAESLTLWKDYAPDTRLINEYGPTEATVGCIVYDAAKDERTSGAMPIGRPIANMRAYVLDGRRAPVGVGVVGELWLAGVGVARGYLGRDDLTQQKFVPDPFTSDPGARMYRSGDLARWRADGVLEYFGRVDEQVKLRGYRIELGDIESKLRACDGVHDAVVALNGKGSAAYLAAFVVPDDADASLDLIGIKAQISGELPDYMIPSTIDQIEFVPLSPAGKVDRRLLPEPSRRVTAGGFRAPRTRTELELTLIWERILQVSPIGADDDFFELGGYSLLVAKLIGAIDREFNAQIPAQQIFSTPTLSQIAAAIDHAGPRRPLDVLVPLRSGGTKSPLFCIHPAGGHVFGFVALAGQGDEERPFIAIQCPNLDPEATPITTVEALADRYVDEIVAYQPQGPYLLAGWSFGGVVAYAVAERLQRAGHEVSILCMFDSYLPSTGKIRQLMSQDELLDSARKSEQVVGNEQSSDLAAMERTYLGAMDMLFRYEAPTYEGRVVIFQAAQSDDLYDVRAADTWEGMISPAPEVRDVPGDHHSMMREPCVEEVAAALDEVLDGL